MPSRSFPLRLLGVLILVAVAFAAGMLVSRSNDNDGADSRAGKESPFGRNPYSATIADDPSFRAAQRRNVETLEAHCNSTGELCAEAGAARRAFKDD